ncbi:hypothetical protein K9M59_02165 [Candidatus Gracilibacteria bacterium]|nr:hypothetical protein [Candidatus Gracilibacteria bacterium]MCF7819647.1 hypothetical protein [Candidatus Gracilibacteria bacterium]
MADSSQPSSHPHYTPPPSKEDTILQMLGSLAANQEIIKKQNEQILRNERNKRIWGIVKWVLILGLFFLSLWSLPALISSMVSDMGGGALDQFLNL